MNNNKSGLRASKSIPLPTIQITEAEASRGLRRLRNKRLHTPLTEKEEYLLKTYVARLNIWNQ